MDEESTSSAPQEPKIPPESPKPMAFTVAFGEGKTTDSQRHKNLVERLQRKHRRGQSMSKIEESSTKNQGVAVTLPRKPSFQCSEGYFSADEKSDAKNGFCRRSDLSLPLKNVTTDKMTQSVPSASSLFSSDMSDLLLKDTSSPELVPISPFTPLDGGDSSTTTSSGSQHTLITRQLSSPGCNTTYAREDTFETLDVDLDASDAVSDAGTYTLDTDNYTEEQKARMSIDAEFKLEQVSVFQKTEDYLKSISVFKQQQEQQQHKEEIPQEITRLAHDLSIDSDPKTRSSYRNFAQKTAGKMLSPILSPTQNMSITQTEQEEMNNKGSPNKTFTKIMFPSQKAHLGNGLAQLVDQGSVISVTLSGAFRDKTEPEKPAPRRHSLTKSEVQVETYVDGKSCVDTTPRIMHATQNSPTKHRKLTANLINVQSISIKSEQNEEIVSGNVLIGKFSNMSSSMGACSGKTSPTKIPSPIHINSRPRSRNSMSSLNVDLSDSSLETESYLRPTQNCINTLQQRLSLDSDQESDCGHELHLNNTPHSLLKQKGTHIRHNSLDGKISNKLEHFQNKNLIGIDQTFVINQYNQTRGMHKVQNSPSNSPIRRSSSFSTKNQFIPAKNTNLMLQDSFLRNSPNLMRNSSAAIQRSASTANIKPTLLNARRGSIGHQKIDRNQFGDTESSSEEDFGKNLRKKDLTNLTNTRYNRAFSLRRGRLEEPPVSQQKCPNTPEVRRKFHPEYVKSERALSMDRKPVKTNEVQSRYLLNITKKAAVAGTASSPAKIAEPQVKTMSKLGNAMTTTNTLTPQKSQVFARTDSGRFSMRANSKPPISGASKSGKKDVNGKKSSARSNSSLSSREKEFQNWKRRKSYDPMKAAAEGKKKELQAKKQNVMTQSFTEVSPIQDCDSSPSHSSSVHRSQSFHGTAALGQLISSEEEEDLTLSADEGFSPPTPSPCELSPARASLRNAWKDRVLH